MVIKQQCTYLACDKERLQILNFAVVSRPYKLHPVPAVAASVQIAAYSAIGRHSDLTTNTTLVTLALEV